MPKAIVIDGRDEIRARAARLFRSASYQVVTAGTGERGIALSREQRPDAVVVSFRLPDMSGVDVVRAVRRAHPTSYIVVAPVQRCRDAMKAMRGGADDCSERAADSRSLFRALRRMVPWASQDGCIRHSVVAHSFQRWADVVVKVIDSSEDLRTLEEWGRFVGVSVGGLRNWCRSANLPARQSLLLARMLRAVVRQTFTALPPDALLNVVDRRTLEKLLTLSGGTARNLPSSVEDFLQRQRLIQHTSAIATLRHTLEGGTA